MRVQIFSDLIVCDGAGLVTRDLERQLDIIFYIGEFGFFVTDMDKKEK